MPTSKFSHKSVSTQTYNECEIDANSTKIKFLNISFEFMQRGLQKKVILVSPRYFRKMLFSVMLENVKILYMRGSKGGHPKPPSLAG